MLTSPSRRPSLDITRKHSTPLNFYPEPPKHTTNIHQQQALQQRAKHFIQRIRQYQQGHHGKFIVCRHQEEEKKMKQKEQRQRGRKQAEEEVRWLRRKRVLQKTYQEEIKQQDIFIAKERHKIQQQKIIARRIRTQQSTNTDLTQTTTTTVSNPKTQKQQASAIRGRRFTTVDNGSVSRMGQLPVLMQSREESVGGSRVKRVNKDKLLYLSGQDRLKIASIGRKLDQLHKINNVKPRSDVQDT